MALISPKADPVHRRKLLTTVALAACAVLATVAAPAAQAQTPAKPTISATASPTLLVVRQASAVSGKVTPASATPTVFLQRKVNGVWLDRGSARVNRTTGAYSIPMAPSQTGVYSLRVRSAGGGVISRTISIRVWSSKQVFSRTGSYTSGRFRLGGTYQVVRSFPKRGCSHLATVFEKIGVPKNNIPIGGSGGTPAYKSDMTFATTNYTLQMETGASCPWTITFWKY